MIHVAQTKKTFKLSHTNSFSSFRFHQFTLLPFSLFSLTVNLCQAKKLCIQQISLCSAKVTVSAPDVKRPNHRPLGGLWWWMCSCVKPQWVSHQLSLDWFRCRPTHNRKKREPTILNMPKRCEARMFFTLSAFSSSAVREGVVFHVLSSRSNTEIILCKITDKQVAVVG